MVQAAHADDLPTLRLVTLRHLIPKTAPPLIFDGSTPISVVEAGLRDSPSTVAVLIDESGILRGTICFSDLGAVDGRRRADAVMSTTTPIVEPECDIEEVRVTMATHDADRVVVVTAAGELLGVLTAGDIAQALSRCAV
jgi:Mg/Co/Ni transporter MgtE